MRTLFGRVWLKWQGTIPIGGVNLRWNRELAGHLAPLRPRGMNSPPPNPQPTVGLLCHGYIYQIVFAIAN